mmetsp:Transcript_15675/g.33351  ORF Transcript_15675/g.33351 Transcript_15675/m.33351 type:complete len:281 (+) Transcript_15675:114-956(+)
MGQGLDVLATCDGSGGHPARAAPRDGSRGFEDVDVRAAGGRGGGRSDPVLLNRELSQKSYQETVKKAREWQRQIRTENRQLERDIERVRREEAKLKQEITAMASKGQAQSVKTLAKQVVKSRQSVARLERTKCSMTALQLHLTTAIASASSAGALKMSADMVKEMNILTQVPELHRTMAEMKVEMGRASAADELMEEAFEESDEETEVDSEVQKVYDELALDTSALLASAARVGTAGPATQYLPPTMATGRGGGGGARVAVPASGSGTDLLMQRLQALEA